MKKSETKENEKSSKWNQIVDEWHHRFAPYLFFICIGVFIAWCIAYLLLKKNYPTVLDEHKDIVLFFWKFSEMVLISGVVQGTIKYFDASKKIEMYISKTLDSQKFTQKIATIHSKNPYSHDYLEDLDVELLNDIWKIATTVLIKKEFPEIYTKVAEKVSNIYFNDKNLSYYYEDYNIVYDLDVDKDNFITINQKSNFKIKRNSTDSLTYSFWYELEKVHTLDNKTAINIKNLKINDIPITNIDHHCSYKTDTTNENKVYLYFEIPLSGKLEYKISHEIEFIYSIEHDNEWYFSTRKITNGLFLEFLYHEDINYKFSEIGHEKFRQIGPNTKIGSKICTISYECEDVFLPMNGYRILF